MIFFKKIVRGLNRCYSGHFSATLNLVLKSVSYQNGGLSFEKIPVGIGFNVLMYLSPHRRIYNCIG